MLTLETNLIEQATQPWFFKGWYRKGQRELNGFSQLPDLAHYFDDPAVLVFDTRKDLRVNVEHIIQETPRNRFPERYKSMGCKRRSKNAPAGRHLALGDGA